MITILERQLVHLTILKIIKVFYLCVQAIHIFVNFLEHLKQG